MRQRTSCLQQQRPPDRRFQSTASALAPDYEDSVLPGPAPLDDSLNFAHLPSPPPVRALRSAKLAALHARLSLSPRLPLQTLARTLVDSSADSNPHFNNASLSQLGNDLMAYHCTEHIICHFPRIPTPVLFAALFAYIGPKALPSLVRDWGVETAAEPGGEVDPGLLQYKPLPPGEPLYPSGRAPLASNRPNAHNTHWRKSVSASIVYDNEFGDPVSGHAGEAVGKARGSTLDLAQTRFARAVLGAVYLHCGRSAAKSFFTAHVLSRHLSFSSLFDFREPTRDLSRLCAREGFEGPVARLISETGRHSRHPVYIVGVYSGDDKLGEGSGSSLDEARTRAAVAALKSWYLYSPLDVRLPSDVEDGGLKAQQWKPAMIDGGEVIV